jgi:UDP-N-acetylglucosamine diphosphorylase / glucose-1-phosphate thymidylyltransferase / UDP-N-acetylgalactosamine diphosphorylase / glucosamine-1-phosphate N-acetyltransferase / galactosamine-1-phosphate N-acetyltransferase
MTKLVEITHYVATFATFPLARWAALDPWTLTSQSTTVVREMMSTLSMRDFNIENEVAVHHEAIIEPGAIIKGPIILSAGCFIAAGAYLRGGNWLGENCTIGPGSEVKSSFIFAGSKLAHFNFVGDSVVGSDVNFEAGSIICNYRNEREPKEIRVRLNRILHPTGCEKFGAVVGDNCRIGANAVIAPGALLVPGTVLGRIQLCDQELEVLPRGGEENA